MVCFMAFAPGTTGPSTAVVRKTRLPQTMGDERPLPSTGGFQRTLFDGPHSSGRSFSAATPVRSGPRQPGQFASPAAEVEVEESERAAAASSATARDSFKRPESFTCGFLGLNLRMYERTGGAGASPRPVSVVR